LGIRLSLSEGGGEKRWWANLRRRNAGGDSEKAEKGGTGRGMQADGAGEAVGVGASSCGLGLGAAFVFSIFEIFTEAVKK
jgi:hypothetical protein